MLETNQEFYCKNLLSFRKTLTQDEMQKEFNSIDTFIKENGLTIVGPKISTTYSITQAMVPSMDVEILIPVNKEFNDTDIYKFKKEIKLVNCLKISHKGNPMIFQNSVMSMQKYIEENKLMPISTLYTVNIKEVKTQEEIDTYEADAYISINPNIF